MKERKKKKSELFFSFVAQPSSSLLSFSLSLSLSFFLSSYPKSLPPGENLAVLKGPLERLPALVDPGLRPQAQRLLALPDQLVALEVDLFQPGPGGALPRFRLGDRLALLRALEAPEPGGLGRNGVGGLGDRSLGRGELGTLGGCLAEGVLVPGGGFLGD